MSQFQYDEQGRLNLYLRAVPYGGPEYLNEKDLQGNFFHKGTDTGPLKEALSYLNHNKLMVEHPELKSLPGIDERIGVAVREEDLSDEEGVVYRIIVDEGYRYKNLLKILAEKDFLLASTTPFQRSVKIDTETGRIDRWEVIEVSPTWKAANPEAERLYKSILEQELTTMAEEIKTSTEETPVVEEEQKPTLTEMVEQAAAEAEKSVSVTLESLDAKFAALEKSITDLMTEIRQRAENQEKSIKDIETAFPKLVELATKKVATAVATDAKLSNMEKSVASEVKPNPAPQQNLSAPGRERRANFGGKAN